MVSLSLPEFALEDAHLGLAWQTACRTLTEADGLHIRMLSGLEAQPPGLPDLMGLCAASGLTTQMQSLSQAVLGLTQLEWKFHTPLSQGDTVHVEAQVMDRVTLPGGEAGFIRLGLRLNNQREETVQSGVFTLLVRARGGE